MRGGDGLLHFIHTDDFDEDLSNVPVTDDEFRAFLDAVRRDPEIGALIPGAGGVRKVRVGVKGKGKSGGARFLYYYVTRRSTVYLLGAYDKSVSENVSAAGKAVLKQLAKELDDEEQI